MNAKRELNDDEEVGESDILDKKKRLLDMNETRTGGIYIPPARQRELNNVPFNYNSEAFQRKSWDALKKSINGLINKVSDANIKNIVVEIFGENLLRGMGIFCRSLILAQQASPLYTPTYACLASIINTKLPSVGLLLVKRTIVNFLKYFKRNDKKGCLNSLKFLAHLVNQRLAHEIVVLQILALLLDKPTDDSVEVSCSFMRDVGAFLTENTPKALHATFERMRSVLHEGDIDKRVQYMIEVLFQIRKDKFKDNPRISEQLDIIEEDDIITHYVALDDELDIQEELDLFSFDSNFEKNEMRYAEIKNEILGESESEENDVTEEEEEGEKEEEDEESDVKNIQVLHTHVTIHDKTEIDQVTLRRQIYLTMMSSVDFEECCHKLMKMCLKPGHEAQLASMIIECCSQEKTYEKYYGLVGERFSNVNRIICSSFCNEFQNLYSTIHRYETNRIRNIAKFFAHLLYTDALPWSIFSCIKLSEEETTSSSRIYLKFLFLELSEWTGIPELNKRLRDPHMSDFYGGIFPSNPRDLRFAINFFTSIGLGGVTDEMREVLKNMPKMIVQNTEASENEEEDEEEEHEKYNSTGSLSESSSEEE